MDGVSTMTVLLSVADAALHDRLRAALSSFTVQPFPESIDLRQFSQPTVVIVDEQGAARVVKALAGVAFDARPHVLYLTNPAKKNSRLIALDAGADAVLPVDAPGEEVRAQLASFARWQLARSHWQAKAGELPAISQQLQFAFKQIEIDRRLTKQLQASALPRSLPEVGRARFAVAHRPCGEVGGDFFDVQQLDEHHVGFFLADAMGHSVPAGLLSVFLRKMLQAREGDCLVSPDEVLARLNRNLMEQRLPEIPFITMAYGIVDGRSGVVRLARAAHPFPVVQTALGDPIVWQMSGTLLGVFDARFPCEERTFGAGDRLILYTDGAAASGPAHEPERLLSMMQQHRSLPLREFVDRVTQELLSTEAQPDDFSMLALEIRPA